MKIKGPPVCIPLKRNTLVRSLVAKMCNRDLLASTGCCLDMRYVYIKNGMIRKKMCLAVCMSVINIK